MAIKFIPQWCFQSALKDYMLMSDIWVKSFSSSFQPFIMYFNDRWQSATYGGHQCSAVRDEFQTHAYITYPTAIPRLMTFFLPFPLPWGNMAFEVNIICFVALEWWLNNGLKYVAKWESEAGDGSNLAFLSEPWHRPIEINESARIFTLSMLQEKKHLLNFVFTLLEPPAAIFWPCIVSELRVSWNHNYKIAHTLSVSLLSILILHWNLFLKNLMIDLYSLLTLQSTTSLLNRKTIKLSI